MSGTDTLWLDLASRVIRVALERKGVSYAALAGALAAIGVKETERSLISRVSRGTVKLTLLLQIIAVTHALPPRHWVSALIVGNTWEERAQAVVAAELGRMSWVTAERLQGMLSDIGVEISKRTVASQLSSGAMTMALFIQCIVVLGSSSLDQYIDFPDLASAVRSTAGSSKK